MTPMRLYGDIGYLASDKLFKILGDKGLEELVKSFFNKLSEEVEWVELEDIDWRREVFPDDILPVYTMGNDKYDIIAWPVLDRGRRILTFELREERPELEGELTWGE